MAISEILCILLKCLVQSIFMYGNYQHGSVQVYSLALCCVPAPSNLLLYSFFPNSFCLNQVFTLEFHFIYFSWVIVLPLLYVSDFSRHWNIYH